MQSSADKAPTSAEILQLKPRRQWGPIGGCATCDLMRSQGEFFFPPHDASRRCESGKHNHCSCEVCW